MENSRSQVAGPRDKVQHPTANAKPSFHLQPRGGWSSHPFADAYMNVWSGLHVFKMWASLRHPPIRLIEVKICSDSMTLKRHKNLQRHTCILRNSTVTLHTILTVVRTIYNHGCMPRPLPTLRR
eukprot:355183-Pelagomonas_calceolata.AAC.1